MSEVFSHLYIQALRKDAGHQALDQCRYNSGSNSSTDWIQNCLALLVHADSFLMYRDHVFLLVSSQVRGVEYRYFIYICSSTARDVTLGLLYGYKTVLQAVTLVMALKTRKVKVPGLNDYREVVLATYLTCLVVVIVFIVNYTMKDEMNSFIAITSLSYFTGATAIIALVFVPKVISRH